jgi:hypothetical protein
MRGLIEFKTFHKQNVERLFIMWFSSASEGALIILTWVSLLETSCSLMKNFRNWNIKLLFKKYGNDSWLTLSFCDSTIDLNLWYRWCIIDMLYKTKFMALYTTSIAPSPRKFTIEILDISFEK